MVCLPKYYNFDEYALILKIQAMGVPGVFRMHSHLIIFMHSGYKMEVWFMIFLTWIDNKSLKSREVQLGSK